mgnify:CR=1 FL=1
MNIVTVPASLFAAERAAAEYRQQRDYGTPEDLEYGYAEAETDIAAELVKSDEVAELVMQVREAAGLLNWIAHHVTLPEMYLRPFRDLDRRARAIDDRADDLIEKAAMAEMGEPA